MSINKEELINILEGKVKLDVKALRPFVIQSFIANHILKGVIALVEIRESIDQLRLTIEEVGRKIDDMSAELAQGRLE
jgi:hypothetical protein